ncbi:MAG: AMP-binding protein [Burkholderiales bacterium]|nr:AMP-binding protein [Burkholderiales bacterium]
MKTAHVDTFARDRLPPREQWPDLVFDLPELAYPERLNCATELVRGAIARGQGDRVAIRSPAGVRWTYRDLDAEANRIACVLVEDLGVVPGNRVLLRGPNSPKMAANWFAIQKAGAIAVATMPLLRAKELVDIAAKAEVSHALCDGRLADELILARPQVPSLRRVALFESDAYDGIDRRAREKPATFDDVATFAEDVAMIAFTSGTTGKPKGTMHTHRDVIAASDCWPKHTLKASPDDVFTGSPPLAFTFGLGGLLVFPLRIGASTMLVERPAPDTLFEAIEKHGATVLFTAPTAYRAMSALAKDRDLSKLRKCVSAGEALPASTRAMWKEATGIDIVDGIGSTEMFHIFISHPDDDVRGGATGKAVPGYRACILGDDGEPLPPGKVGRLAVKGPTGCKYLDDPRQTSYVQRGWNLTGDAYLVDEDGWYVFQARTDDMIVTAGYNIAGPEVESALMRHPDVADCGVVAAPDEERGMIVKAYVVLKPGVEPGEETTKLLQEYVKATIAPYKYPRAVEYVEALPRTETGKLQRFRLRTMAKEGSR